jgi:hypothetical protein
MGDYGGFGKILQEARDDARRNAETPPVACPNDGTPLQEHNGVLHCPFDGYETPAR